MFGFHHHPEMQKSWSVLTEGQPSVQEKPREETLAAAPAMCGSLLLLALIVQQGLKKTP